MSLNSPDLEKQLAAEWVIVFDRGRDPYPVTKSRTIIGRSKVDSDLSINDPSVSRRHCLLELTNDSLLLIDMYSRNGVVVNGERVQRIELQPGDRICIGRIKGQIYTKAKGEPLPSSAGHYPSTVTLEMDRTGLEFAPGRPNSPPRSSEEQLFALNSQQMTWFQEEDEEEESVVAEPLLPPREELPSAASISSAPEAQVENSSSSQGDQDSFDPDFSDEIEVLSDELEESEEPRRKNIFSESPLVRILFFVVIVSCLAILNWLEPKQVDGSRAVYTRTVAIHNELLDLRENERSVHEWTRVSEEIQTEIPELLSQLEDVGTTGSADWHMAIALKDILPQILRRGQLRPIPEETEFTDHLLAARSKLTK